MRFIRRRCGCTSAKGCSSLARTEGNTRLYTDEDLQRLEFILSLARDLGVNISGMAIILQMRERMEEMQRQIQEFVQYIQQEVLRAPRPRPIPRRARSCRCGGRLPVVDSSRRKDSSK
jgi:DNA-binding transcriptional MerR regulator